MGTKPAPMPWILCLPGFTGSPARVCVMTGLATGSTAMALKSGFRCLMTSATPVIVPPVPTPATMMSTFPPVSAQISSAVVLWWISGFAGFSNCCGMNPCWVRGGDFLGLGDRAFHALGRGRQHEFGT